MLLAFALGLVLYTSYRFWHYLNTIPINESTLYYKDPFGYIYKDATTGCLDICFFKSFKKLPADRDTFEILMVASPFTRIHSVGEVTATRYAKDKLQVFWNAEKVSGADPVTFVALSYDLGKDDSQYYIYDKPLHTYIHDEISAEYQFLPDELEVISYSPSKYVILKVSSVYYYLRLNPQPKSIDTITQSEALNYPKLQ